MSAALDRLTAAVANLTNKATAVPVAADPEGATAAELNALSDGIDATTGIIGTPRRSGWNLDAEMLFEPNLQLNQQLTVNSSVEPYINGTYAVQAIAHQGIISGAKDGGCETSLTLVGYPTGFNQVPAL